MKPLFLLPFLPFTLSACVFLDLDPIEDDPEPPECGSSVEEAPVIYTKEGFPIIDDQAPLPFPCPVILVTSSTDDHNTTTIDVLDNPPAPKSNRVKSNSGRGNGSEGSPDVDPGNSGDHNQGGD